MNAADKLQLDLPLVLPDIHGAKDLCVGRLIAALSGRPGIEEAHVVGVESGSPQLCLHYDPETISLARVREIVHSAGAQLTSRFAHLTFRADAPLHARSARGLAQTLRQVPGILEADVAVSGAVRIEYDRTQTPEQTLLERIAALGYPDLPGRSLFQRCRRGGCVGHRLACALPYCHGRFEKAPEDAAARGTRT